MPLASITRTPAGALSVASSTIARIESPETRIALPVSKGPPLPSAMRAPRMTRVGAGSGVERSTDTE